MTTRETIETYFGALGAGDGWESLLSHDMEFTSHGTPSKHLVGRDAYLESTRGFYGMIRSLVLRDMVVDGDKACAFVSYELEAPSGQSFTSEVAERFIVADGDITSFSIYFDATPFPG